MVSLELFLVIEEFLLFSGIFIEYSDSTSLLSQFIIDISRNDQKNQEFSCDFYNFGDCFQFHSSFEAIMLFLD